jgi:hypothetical protein
MSCQNTRLSFKPGQTIRFKTEVADAYGRNYTPSSIKLTIHSPLAVDTVYATPVADAVGLYHQDVDFPIDSEPGVWLFRWEVSGPALGVDEGRFEVERLLFGP